MAVGMSLVRGQLAGPSVLAHHTIAIPVPRGRDHRLREAPSLCPGSPAPSAPPRTPLSSHDWYTAIGEVDPLPPGVDDEV